MKETIVISLGGSLIVPDTVDVAFLQSFRKLVVKLTDQYSFILVCGGGKTARNYIEAGREIIALPDDELDWIGIKSTHLNAQLVKAIFKKECAEQTIILNPTEEYAFDKPILVAGGWKPGRSTDTIAVLLAKKWGASKVINLSNIAYVYDSDPKLNPDAKKIEDITWDALQQIVGTEWKPGLSAPFDPIAVQEAKGTGISVALVKGDQLDEMERFIKGETFKGTFIHD